MDCITWKLRRSYHRGRYYNPQVHKELDNQRSPIKLALEGRFRFLLRENIIELASSSLGYFVYQNNECSYDFLFPHYPVLFNITSPMLKYIKYLLYKLS